MSTLRLALLCPCVLVALTACVDPPSAPAGSQPRGEIKVGAGAPAPALGAGATPAKPGPSGKSFAPDPVFAGQPVSKTELPGGLIVEDFVLGSGDEAKVGSEVSVHYYGTLSDGTMFDTSQKRGRPFTFAIGKGRVIKGWDQGVPGMKVGGKRRLTVPAELGYGPRAKGKIPANSELIFTIELVESVGPMPDAKGDEAFAGDPVQRTQGEDGLVIEDFALGGGRVAAKGDKVWVHYTGKLENGTVFDSSVPRKQPIAFVLGTGKVIKGWDLGIEGMKVGGLRRLTIPAELAYGARAKGQIPANSRLTFTVELMDARDAPAQPKRPPQLRSPSRR